MILCGYNVDTLNICMKEFIIFVCTDSTEIFLSKLRSSCSNYNLPSFFTDSYCAGVSNKHCLLTFFIFLAQPAVEHLPFGRREYGKRIIRVIELYIQKDH